MKFIHCAPLALLLIVASSGQFAAQAKTVSVVEAWARATPNGSTTGVIYMTLVNSGKNADRLLRGATPIADSVLFHSTVKDNGVMRMRALTAIDIAPGERVTLKPGGTHAMMIGLKQALKEGQTFPLILDFEKAGKIDVDVSVEAIGATVHQNMNGK
jgi:hypothetical protein